MKCIAVKLGAIAICTILCSVLLLSLVERHCSGIRVECCDMADSRLRSISLIKTLLPNKAIEIAIEYHPPGIILRRMGGFARGRCKVSLDDFRNFCCDRHLRFGRMECVDSDPPGVGTVWCLFNEAEKVNRDGVWSYRVIMPNGVAWYSPIEDGPVYNPCPQDGLIYSKIANDGAGLSYFYDIRKGWLYFNWTSN